LVQVLQVGYHTDRSVKALKVIQSADPQSWKNHPLHGLNLS